MNERVLDVGETLFEFGDTGTDVCLVTDGTLEVITPTGRGDLVVATLGPGDVVGEIAAVIGSIRTATVRAATRATVRQLEDDQFDRWLSARPDRADRVSAQARARIDRTRVVQVVAELIGVDNRELIDEVADAVDWVTVEAGSELFAQGDTSDAAYILVGGQMRCLSRRGDEVVLDMRIGRGEFVGEMGVIEDTPRSATAVALRDCTLARIPRAVFAELTATHPELMLRVTRRIIGKFSDRPRPKPHAGMVALLVTAPDSAAGLVAELASEIGCHGSTVHLDENRVSQLLNRHDIAQARKGSVAETRLTELLHELDTTHRWVVLECGSPDTEWGRRSLRTADRVAVICSARPGPAERAMIESARRVVEEAGDFDLWLCPLRPATVGRPGGTAELLDLSGAWRAVHLKAGDSRSTRRLGRLLSGNGTGIVLSGGGARSYGQIGALRAFGELGIEIDAIAGTSMGSVIGAFAATTDDIDPGAYRRNLERIDVLDYTLPFASIFSARKVTAALRRAFHPTQIEDTVIPFLCVSTNLTRAEVVEHRRGDLTHALRASVSLPGVFPPVSMDGDLLVDGGVLENLPARPLRADPGIGTVIAVDVTAPAAPAAGENLGLALSGADILRRRLRNRSFRYPRLAHTVISSMLVGSAQARNNALDNEDIDVYVPLDLSTIKLLDFDRLDEAVERGYRDASPMLESWLEGRDDRA